MSCIIFRYRRFYAIICKITHFFYPKRKNPPLFAHSALHKAKSVPCTTLPARAASASPPAAETMTGGEHFRHPGRRCGAVAYILVWRESSCVTHRCVVQ